MSEAMLSFIGSVIVGLLSLFGILYSTNSTRKAYEAVNDEKMKQIYDKIDALEKKQDKHNNLITRTFKLEEANSNQEKDIQNINESIKEIKQDISDTKKDLVEVKESLHNLEIVETKLEGKVQK